MVESRPARRLGRKSYLGLALLLATVLAPGLAPHPPETIIDPVASRQRPPGTRLVAVELTDGRTLLVDRVTVLGNGNLKVLRAGVEQELPARWLASEPSSDGSGFRRFILGSDHLGRDLWARLAYAWRNSLFIAGAATALALIVGALVGLAAAYSGGRIDRWTMRLVDIVRAVPKLFLLLAVAATLEPSPVLLVVLLAAMSWMSIARSARAEARSLRGAPFTEAARASGCSASRILVIHHLPHLKPALIALGLAQLSSLILLEAALSFLGAGLPPPAPSLGGLLADVALRGPAPWWMVLFPGLAIASVSLLCRWLAVESLGARPNEPENGE